MKTIFLLIALCVLSFSDLFGKIRNGYETQLQSNLISLHKLRSLLEKIDLTPAQRGQIKAKIENLINHLSYYELTEELIRRLSIISPDIFNEIDTIRDRKGRPTDVYVKLIPKENAKIELKAASFFYQGPTDKDASISEYGAHSVSVEIWISDNALFLLSHELGHIKYVVPNLATYIKFYHKHYQRPLDTSCIGHSPYDQSRKYADRFERKFLADNRNYLQNGGLKSVSIPTLFTRIRRNIRLLEVASQATVSNSSK